MFYLFLFIFYWFLLNYSVCRFSPFFDFNYKQPRNWKWTGDCWLSLIINNQSEIDTWSRWRSTNGSVTEKYSIYFAWQRPKRNIYIQFAHNRDLSRTNSDWNFNLIWCFFLVRFILLPQLFRLFVVLCFMLLMEWRQSGGAATEPFVVRWKI